MKIALRLRYCTTTQRPASAWLLPGGDVRQWLAELSMWGVPLAEATWSPLPHPDRPGELLGAIVLTTLDGQQIKTQQAMPYGWIASQVLAPVEAACDPPLSEEELKRLLPSANALLVWHPAAGLFQLEPASALPIASLLATTLEADRSWNAGQPGIALNQRLFSVQPLVRPTIEQVLDAGRDGIGSQPLAGGTLPSAPGEPIGGSLGKVIAQAGLTGASLAAGGLATSAGAIAAGGAALIGGLAGGLAGGALAAEAGVLVAGAAGVAGAVVGGLIGKAAKAGQTAQHQPAGSSWFRQLAEWAKRRRQAVEKNLEFLRHRQIERLLNLLQTSPDLGLKFALPMAGNHRGLAPPGSNLVERDVNFNLSNLGGGGRSVDLWNLPGELRLRLFKQYRELANREIALRRFRRAAYILAELLGDLNAAAVALAEGSHYREAAILYEQRLHQPLAAAKCLERGGLVAEAIALYEQLQQWETVGDLYGQLEQGLDAERAYRTAVDGHLSRQGYLEAARLLEHKLKVPDEAHTALLEGWPSSPSARKCLDASFELLARHQRHEDAAAMVRELQAAHGKETPGQDLAAALVKVASEYPQEAVRSTASEMTRLVISQRLPVATTREMESLLESLAGLVPADRLLARDCRRYQSARDEQQLAVSRPRPARREAVRVTSWFRLPPAEWKTAVSIGDELYAAGWMNDDHLVLVRARWDGAVQLPVAEPWRAPREYQQHPILLAADPKGLAPLYFHIAATSFSLRPVAFRPNDKFPAPLSVQPHPGCDEDTVVLQYGPGGTVLVGKFVPDDDGQIAIQLVPYNGDQLLPGIQTLRLPDSEFGTRPRRLPFFSRGADLFLGYDRTLISKRVRPVSTELHGEIRSITGSPAHTRPRIVVGCEQGGIIVWDGAADTPHTQFAMDLFEPVVGINRGGWIAAATRDLVQIYRTKEGKLAFVTEIEGPHAEPIAVLATDDAARIAIVTQEGTVLIYEGVN